MTSNELPQPTQWPGLRKTSGSPIEYVFTCADSQSPAIMGLLQSEGLHVEDYRGYPAFREAYSAEIRKALQLVFENRLPGWWNLKPALLRKRICTEAEFEAARSA